LPPPSAYSESPRPRKEATERMGSTIRDLSRKLSDGWEIRDVVCRLLPNEPEAGKRTIVRVDTGELVAIEDMYTGAAIEAPPAEQLFATTVIESVVDQINSGALDRGDVKCTATVTGASQFFDPKSEASTEDRKRTRKPKMQGQDAILPDPRNQQPGAPTL